MEWHPGATTQEEAAASLFYLSHSSPEPLLTWTYLKSVLENNKKITTVQIESGQMTSMTFSIIKHWGLAMGRPPSSGNSSSNFRHVGTPVPISATWQKLELEFPLDDGPPHLDHNALDSIVSYNLPFIRTMGTLYQSSPSIMLIINSQSSHVISDGERRKRPSKFTMKRVSSLMMGRAQQTHNVNTTLYNVVRRLI